jgi:hypothetical protein
MCLVVRPAGCPENYNVGNTTQPKQPYDLVKIIIKYYAINSMRSYDPELTSVHILAQY